MSGQEDRAKRRLEQAAGELVIHRLRFAAPFVLLSLSTYLTLTILTGFTSLLAGFWVGPFSLLSLLLIAHIPAVGLLTFVYERRARLWDKQAADTLLSLMDDA